jgi:hypothetical protein
LTSHPPLLDGRLPPVRHIEVKGRVAGADTVTVTRNEILYALNQGEKFVLAIVLVHGDESIDGPHYIQQPFDSEPDPNITSVNYNLGALLQKAVRS